MRLHVPWHAVSESTVGIVARNTGRPGSARPEYSPRGCPSTRLPGARVVRVSGEVMLSSAAAGMRASTTSARVQWLWCGGTLMTLAAASTSRASRPVASRHPRSAARPSARRDALHGYAALRYVTVTVADERSPSVAIRAARSSPAGGGEACRTSPSSASRPRRGASNAALVDGVLKRRGRSLSDDPRVHPCANGTDTLPVDTRHAGRRSAHALGAGDRHARGTLARSIARRRDRQHPSSLTAGAHVDGGDGWKARNEFASAGAIRAERHAPSRARSLRVCPLRSDPSTRASVPAAFVPHDDRRLAPFAVPGPGQWRAYVWLRDAAGNESADLRRRDDPPLRRHAADARDPRAVARPPGRRSGRALATPDSRLAVRELLLRAPGPSRVDQPPDDRRARRVLGVRR